MPRVIHFDIAAHEPERAVRFYSEVFGWQVRKWDGPMDYWLIQTGPDGEPGIDGGLSVREAGAALTTMNTIGVPSVDEFVEKITRNGGKVTMSRTAIPGVGYFASCEDTEGNAFGIMQSDPSAR
jgi:predicted enzyme related to lactoylglutathione lyase